jgi:ABC-2 type transport system ATP-binding protein
VAVEDIDRLRALRERRMQVTLSEPAPLGGLTALDGVRVVSADEGNGHLELAINGPIKPVLKCPAELPVSDLTYAPPTLEDVFIHYYEDDEDIESVREAAS